MDWGSTWDFLWHFLIIFAWIAYLLVLFQILTDLLWRDHKTSGWVKAIWVIFLIVFPWLTALVYLIARGKGMTERARRGGRGCQEADRRLHQAGSGPFTGAGDRRREGAPGGRHDHPDRVRRAEGQGPGLIEEGAQQSVHKTGGILRARLGRNGEVAEHKAVEQPAEFVHPLRRRGEAGGLENECRRLHRGRLELGSSAAEALRAGCSP